MEELVEVGSGRDVAGLPLPAAAPGCLPVLLGPGRRDGGPEHGAVALAQGGEVAAGGSSVDPLAQLTSAVAAADRMATATAAFRDELVATAYREGAVEYAARLTDLRPEARREWGARAMLAELACALHLPETTLSRRLARQAALAAFPRFRQANLDGLVSSWHCDAMLDVFGHVSDEAALAAADEALVGTALAATASELRVSARRWRARHVPRTLDESRRNLADRRVEVGPADDDLCWLTALLPAAQAMAIYHRLSDIATAVQGADDSRTLPQLRADAMCDLLLDGPLDAVPGGWADEVAANRADTGRGAGPGEARGVRADDGMADDARGARQSPAGGGTLGAVASPGCGLAGIRPTVVLTVPVLSLLGRGDEPADLEGFGPIDIETARELAAQAPSFVRVLTHPETGAVLSVGRDRYRVPADLKAALAVRDETCRFPGCRRRAARCDVDHSTAWEHGGTTEIDNLAHLCRKHHRLKHQGGWDVRNDGGGVLTWTSPLGRQHRSEPARQVTSGSGLLLDPPPPRLRT